MRHALLHALIAGPLLLAGASGPARAQLSVAPESLAVVLPQGEEGAVTLALTNEGPTALRYCLDFDRPLQRYSDDVRAGSTCLAPGGRLFHLDQSAGIGWSPLGLGMTPGGGSSRRISTAG